MACLALGLSSLPGISPAQSLDLDSYKPADLPESSRRQLPTAVRALLNEAQRDAVELSPIMVSSPKATLGFNASYDIAMSTGASQYEVRCAPLTSGLLRCSTAFTLSGQVKQTVYQGLYAFGGLVRLYNAFLTPDNRLFPIKPAIKTRYRQITQPALPSPGIDVVFDFNPQWATDRATFIRTRCEPSAYAVDVPAVLKAQGAVSVIVCASEEPPYFKEDSSWELERQLSNGFDPGIFGGAVYFWLADKGLALPAALFYPNQLKGHGSLGYFGVWRSLITGGPVPMPRVANVKFEWVRPE